MEPQGSAPSAPCGARCPWEASENQLLLRVHNLPAGSSGPPVHYRTPVQEGPWTEAVTHAKVCAVAAVGGGEQRP